MGSLEGVISLGPWGGAGGYNWRYRGNRGIATITIHQDVTIKSISFMDVTGSISGTFGAATGEEKHIEIRWPSEYFKYITGTYGDHGGKRVIRSLSFGTNLRTYGPFGTINGGDPFSVPIRDNVLVGFHGKSDSDLDAIGFIVQPFDSHGSISFGPWGGLGGDRFSVTVGTWIKEIIIHERNNIIQSICFKDVNSHQYGKFGGNGDQNDVGHERIIEINEPLEHLTSVAGTYGNISGLTLITSLSFVTNMRTHGPFGTVMGTSFSLPIHGSLVNGFHGRAGNYLEAIGIHVRPIQRGKLEGTISIGPWGGPGGDSWIYTTNRGINQIIIHVGSNIKSISFRDTSGRGSTTFGGNDPNDTGEMQMITISWPSEHLVSISGTYGIFGTLLTDRSVTIQSLTFTTNWATYGPFGSPSGTSFSVPIDNHTVVGFHGRAGNYLDAIGIFVKPAI